MRRLLKDEGAMEILAIIGLIAVAAAGLVGITIENFAKPPSIFINSCRSTFLYA